MLYRGTRSSHASPSGYWPCRGLYVTLAKPSPVGPYCRALPLPRLEPRLRVRAIPRICNWSPYVGSGTTPSCGSAPGRLRRMVKDTKGSSGSCGGLPRPPRGWHMLQARALYRGPRPSRAVVLLGAITHAWRKKEPPVKNSSCRSKDRLLAGFKKVLRTPIPRVASPAGKISAGSGGAGGDGWNRSSANRTSAPATAATRAL